MPRDERDARGVVGVMGLHPPFQLQRQLFS